MQGGEATLRRLLHPLAGALADPDTREVVVNRPGSYGVENTTGWHWYDAPELTYRVLEAITILAARATGQEIGSRRAFCSSRLPDGGRISMSRPPLMPPDIISLTIRKRATSFTPTLGWMGERGWFDFLPDTRDWVAWFRDRVEARWTFAFTGETGSSKTTAAEACIRAIPLHERIVTVESAPEWLDLPHRNWVPHLYAQAGQEGFGLPSAEEVLEHALRERPDRILFGELRTGEAWGYMRALQAGHRGSITTAHTDPGREGFLDAVGLMVRQNAHSAGVPERTVRRLLEKQVNVVVHCAKVPGDPVPYRATHLDVISEPA